MDSGPPPPPTSKLTRCWQPRFRPAPEAPRRRHRSSTAAPGHMADPDGFLWKLTDPGKREPTPPPRYGTGLHVCYSVLLCTGSQ